MCVRTSARGLLHNLNNWKYDICGDYKIMEQDYETAKEAFSLYGLEDLFYRLDAHMKTNNGGFHITKDEHDDVVAALKNLDEVEHGE